MNSDRQDFPPELSDSDIEAYINNFFGSVNAQGLQQLLNRPENTLFKNTCRTLSVLRVICDAYANEGEDIQSKLKETDLLKTAVVLYEKYISVKEHTCHSDESNKLSASEKFKYLLAISELIAYHFCNNSRTPVSEAYYVLDSQLCKDNPESLYQHLPIINIYNFGLIELIHNRPHGELIKEKSIRMLLPSMPHRFIHESFMHYFCARFLISFLQNTNHNLKSNKHNFPYENWYFICESDNFEDFIRLNIKDPNYNPVWKFVEAILQHSEHFKDEATLRIFKDCLEYPLCESKKKTSSLITELSQKNYEFKITRNPNGNTLFIEFIQSGDGLKRRILNLDKLQSELMEFLKLNRLSDKIKLHNNEDNDDYILTVESDDTTSIDEVVSWLSDITDVLPSQPLNLQRATLPKHFYIWKNVSVPVINDEHEECKELSTTCKLF